jgi:hypothetical protein
MKLSIFFQRLEAGVFLIAMIASYQSHNYSWLAFVIGMVAVDISVAGYLLNNKIGAVIYNLAHSLIGPLALLTLSLTAWPQLDIYVTIWLAHVAMDRMLGFGLKDIEGFRHTHLGHIGSKRRK